MAYVVAAVVALAFFFPTSTLVAQEFHDGLSLDSVRPERPRPSRPRARRRTAPPPAPTVTPPTSPTPVSTCAERPDTPLFRNLLSARSKEEALFGMPEGMRKRFILLTECEGRQKCDEDYPRPVNFSLDGKTMVAASGFPGDPNGGDLEIITSQEDGRSCGYTISYESGRAKLGSDQSRCTGCHGENMHPLFDAYPKWKNAYGGKIGSGSLDTFTAAEKESFRRFAKRANQEPTYKHLGIQPGDEAFHLPDSDYRPNTVFAARAAHITALQTANRLAANENYDSLKDVLMLGAYEMKCDVSPQTTAQVERLYTDRLSRDAGFREKFAARPPATAGSDSMRVMLYRLMGSDPAQDLRLDLRGGDAKRGKGDDDPFSYWTGSDRIGDLVEGRVFLDLYRKDAAFRDRFASNGPFIERILSNPFERTSEQLQELDRQREMVNERRTAFSEALGPGLHQYFYDPC